MKSDHLRVAYLIKVNINLFPGVVQKIGLQCDTWVNLGVDVKIFCISETRTKTDLFNQLDVNYYDNFDPFSTKKWRGIIEDLKEFDPDLVYTRNWFLQPFIYNVQSQFSVICEINTDERKENKLLAGNSLKGRIKTLYHQITNQFFQARFSGICFVSHEIQNRYPQKNKSIVIPNSINLGRYHVAKTPQNEIPKLIFLGTPGYSWHGIDLILNLAQQTRGRLEFHIVGEEKDSSEVPDNVTMHGFLTKSEYQNILDECDIGLGTLALFRKSMKEASPLKVREYIANGLPIIVGYNDTAFRKIKPEWIYTVPNTEEGVNENIDGIVNFSNKYRGVRIPHVESESFVDMISCEKNRIEFFKNVINE